MRLGIFGGTFNPIHYGHLINAEFIRDNFLLDRVILIPSGSPVHKQVSCNISADDRLIMTRLAAAGNKRLDVSSIETDSVRPSYTIKTIENIRMNYPDAELSLIIGSDSFNELDTWREYERLVESVALIVIRREGLCRSRDEIIKKCRDLNFAENPIIEISSTDIRERIKNNLSIKYMLPESVENYIYEKGLYRN